MNNKIIVGALLCGFVLIFLFGCSKKSETDHKINVKQKTTIVSSKTAQVKKNTATVVNQTVAQAEDFSYEPTKYNDDSGLRMLSMQNNPEFSLAGDKKPQAPGAQALDSLIRPVLARYFNGAKLVSEGGQETRLDGEVVLFTLNYKVSGMIQRSDAAPLHAAFLADHFSMSPRLGAKPTDTDKFIMMSFFARKYPESFSLVIRIDLMPQTIKVESYQLGSKYDRLM